MGCQKCFDFSDERKQASEWQARISWLRRAWHWCCHAIVATSLLFLLFCGKWWKAVLISPRGVNLGTCPPEPHSGLPEAPPQAGNLAFCPPPAGTQGNCQLVTSWGLSAMIKGTQVAARAPHWGGGFSCRWPFRAGRDSQPVDEQETLHYNVRETGGSEENRAAWAKFKWHHIFMYLQRFYSFREIRIIIVTLHCLYLALWIDEIVDI